MADVDDSVKGEKKRNTRKEEKKKALFIQRFIAFVIDVFLVSCIVSLVATPFVDSSKNKNIEKETTAIVQKIKDNEITSSDYLIEYSDLYYKYSRNNGVLSILTIFFNVLYFIVYQTYSKGQTIGKKLMKIRVVSDKGELLMDQMVIRACFSNFILFDMIVFTFMLFLPKSLYFYSALTVEMVQYIVVFVSVLMIMYRKDGCSIHDKLVHTMVIREL